MRVKKISVNPNQKLVYRGVLESVPEKDRIPGIELLGKPPLKMKKILLTDLGTQLSWDVILSPLKGLNLKAYKDNKKRWAYDKGLRIGDRPIPFSLIPLPVAKFFLENHAKNLKVLSNVLDRAEIIMRKGDLDFLVELITSGLPAFDVRFLKNSLKKSPIPLNKITKKRWDAFLDSSSLRTIEQNRIACEAVLDTHILFELSEDYANRFLGMKGVSLPIVKMVYEWLKKHYRQHPYCLGKRPPRIAVSIERGYPVKETEFPRLVGMFNALAREDSDCSGAILACPEDFFVIDDKMWVKKRCGRIPVDVIWVNTYKLIGYDEEKVADYWRILENPETYPLSIDGLSRIGASKIIQSVMIWLPFFQRKLNMTAIEKEYLKQYIPFALDPLLSPFIIVNGKRKNSKTFLIEHKNWLVSKPLIGFHGEEFVAGIDCSDDEWRQVVNHRLGGGYVFQLRIPYSVLSMPIVDDIGKLEMRDMAIDFNIQLVGDEGFSVYARSSPAARYREKLLPMNVTSGGGVVPVMVI